ncbi:hypothetical protein B0I21_10795 [Sphingobacterium paludis]|uniref:Lipoprotein n=2 Tax=Sphingobacterium paludis TaxID=1476465 RepID=A0A4R7CV99_9SPHI|nr:hypothetical protein B0I21_10795 [Sphingobacterium paludis]
MLLASCSVNHNKQKKVEGGYSTDYSKQRSVPKDSVEVEIHIFNAEDNSAVNLDGSQFSLNEHANKVIDENKCVATFAVREVPSIIFLRVRRPEDKWPMYFKIEKAKLKKNNKVFFKGYLENNTGAIL